MKETEPKVKVLTEDEEREHSGHSHDHNHSHNHSHDHSHSHHHEEEEEGVSAVLIIRLLAGLGLLAGAVFTEGTLSLCLYICAYIIFGYDVIIRAVQNLLRGELFDENFLMSIATIGAFFIGEYPEAASVMLFYQVGEFFQDLASGKAARSVKSLLNIMPENANLITEQGVEEVSSKSVSVGDLVLVKAGERVPLDGIVEEGEAFINKQALTGESLPEKAACGDTVLSGSVNGSSPLKIRVTKPYSDSAAQKIARLTEEAAGKKSKAENFITKFARIYTPTVVLLAVLIAVIPTIFVGDWRVWLYRALIFLVASCPCALVVSIPLGFFAGNGRASSRGILIKGSSYIQSLAETDTVVFDKTGTLTEGEFKIAEVKPVGVSEAELLKICGSVEGYSTHSIAKAVFEAAGADSSLEAEGFEEISGKGVRAVLKGKTVLAGNAALMEENGIEFERSEDELTSVYTALDGKFIGTVTLRDGLKPDSKNTVKELKKMGIKTVLMTGDKKKSAAKIGGELELDEVYSQLLPQHKLEKLEGLYKKGSRVTAYLGDGINDAPVLRRADVGVAMGALGSDSAIEAADCVIMSDEPSKIIEAIRLSKMTMARIKQNTVFVIGVKVVVLALSAVGLGNMWLAVFADIGTALIAILNSIR